MDWWLWEVQSVIPLTTCIDPRRNLERIHRKIQDQGILIPLQFKNLLHICHHGCDNPCSRWSFGIYPIISRGRGISGFGRLSLLTQISPKSVTALFLILSAWFVYSPFILFLGLAGVDSWNSSSFKCRHISLSMAIDQYRRCSGKSRGRIQDLAWAVIPLLALAARQIVAMVKFPLEYRATFIAKAIFDFVILGFTWLNLVGIARSLVSGVLIFP